MDENLYRELLEAYDKKLDKFANLLRSASHALRSYQHGNSSPDLAEETADAIDKAVTNEREP